VLDPLPIDPFIDAIARHLRQSRAVVVTAHPGAGKTTRVPPALCADGPVILLQPRRVAARAIAQRIADERGWAIGGEVGWQVRLERRFGPRTRLLVATEGVLTARLQQDPLISQFHTVVLDEFHERSVHADLAIALARQAWRARDDLRIVVMSATLDSAVVSAFLDDCPVIDVPGRSYPLDVGYAAGQSVADAVAGLSATTAGDILCFLPGAFEIRRAMDEISARAGTQSADIVALHGSLDAAAQDSVLRPSSSPRRRIVVATNIAETSVTVPRVAAVVDSGLHKVARYDAERAIDSLEVERITADSADQRAGRAARLGPGSVRRLWDARDRLRPHREPEIRRVDLSSTCLDIMAWGGDPRTFEWFERPQEEAIEAALTLLGRLGAIEGGRLTNVGRRLQPLPLPPRLGRMLVAADGATTMARACALLSERHALTPRGIQAQATASDLLSAIDRWSSVPPHVQRVAREIEQLAGASATTRSLSEVDFRRAVLAGYPDRVAQRREPRSPRVRLASGAGAVIAPESGVTEGEFLVALDVRSSSASTSGGRAPRSQDGSNASIRLASLVEREWLAPNATEVVHRFDSDSGSVKATVLKRYDALVLGEQPTTPDPAVAVTLMTEAWLARGPEPDDEQLLRRLRFAGRPADADELVRAAAAGARTLADVSLSRGMSPENRRALDRDAPETILVPSGRAVRLEYEEDGGVSASVKLQELFGLADTPRVGMRKEPVRLALLAPNGRPVQMTRDLRSFWDRTYPEVRKELRGRYPKHPWPDDPWSATPTARTTKRRT
jgi:ATP-dependent helicase HrpB